MDVCRMKLVSMFSWLLLLMLVANISASEDGTEDANYLFTKLKRKIDIIKNEIVTPDDNQTAHFRTKRSDRSKKGNNADDLILSSLSSYCHHFNSDPDISKHLEKRAENLPLSQRDMRGYIRYNSDSTHPLDVFPVKILKQGEGDKVWIVFYIAHSKTATVSWLNFHGKKDVVLNFSDSACHTIISKARFALPYERNMEERFRIDSETGNFPIDVEIILRRNDPTIISGHFTYPFFQVQDSLLPNDRAFKIDIEVTKMAEKIPVDIGLWNRDTHTTIVINAIITWKTYEKSDIEIEFDNPTHAKEYGQLFREKILGNNYECYQKMMSSNTQYSYSSLHYPRQSCLRITVNTTTIHNFTHGRISFHLTPQVTNEHFFRSTFKLSVPFTQPEGQQDHQATAPLYLIPTTRFRCNKNGNLDNNAFSSHTSGNCTLYCQARGVGISHIYISKRVQSKEISTFRSGSYVLPDSAVAILDVGKAKDDIDGEYDCTVVTKQGEVKTQPMSLYTRHFTKITSLHLDNSDTKVLNVSCNVYGDHSVKVSLFVCDENCNNKTQLNINDSDKYQIYLRESDTHRNISVLVPWKELKYPISKIGCRAEGDRGKDIKDRSIVRFYQNRFGIFPMINRSSISREEAENGSRLIQCTASGERPLTIRLSFKPTYRLSYELLHVKNQTYTVGDGEEWVTLSTYHDYSPLHRPPILYCEAINRHGTLRIDELYRGPYDYLNDESRGPDHQHADIYFEI